MNSAGPERFSEFLAGVGDAPAAAGALTLDLLRQFGPFELGLLWMAISAGSYLQAATLQKRWVAAVAKPGDRMRSLSRGDWELALPALLARLIIWLVRLPFTICRSVYGSVSAWLHRRRAAKSGAPTPQKPHAPEQPYLAATLGPSYVLAALGVVAMYGVSLLLAPWVATALGLDSGRLVWQIALLGSRAEWGMHLPLEDNPRVAALVALSGWLMVWSTLSRLIRGAYRESLGRNLIRERDDEGTLELWRQGFATRQLIAPSEPYRNWAVPLLSGAFLGLLGAWFSLDGGGLHPSDFAMAWIVWLSWAIHLRLRGEMSAPVVAEESEGEPEVVASGWQSVLEDLRERLQVAEPRVAEPPRAIEPLPPAVGPPAGSPLLAELLGDLPGLSDMQQREIARLTQLGHVHIESPLPPGELTLEALRTEDEDAPAAERHHRIVLAPEGWGKTTLAFLAAANHALVHSRSALIVVRREDDARMFEGIFRPRLERSTLRWNVRMRRLGLDLMDDLSQGIVPDVVLTDLRTLVTDLLGDVGLHEDFLRRVGLVIIDDAESFLGAVEVHAQLAFRRLRVVLRQVQGSPGSWEGGHAGTLVLARETMHRTERWVRDLCGLEATVRQYGYGVLEARRRQQVEQAAAGVASRDSVSKAQPSPQASPVLVQEGHHQRFYRLGDFRTPYGESITLQELIVSCELQAVPWHYRHCGDGHRHLGPGTLDLPEQPEWAVAADEACVVMLAGAWSEVRRELRQLRMAGVRFSRIRHRGRPSTAPTAGMSEPIALVTVVDSDEEMAFTLRDAGSSLLPWIERLPLPFLRPPGGPTVDSHLATDLVERWNEVGDLLDTYGHGVATKLQELACVNLLVAEAHTDLASAASAYEERLYIRALRRGLQGEGIPQGPGLLPKRVDQVELTSTRRLTVIDQSTRLRLFEVDAEASHLAYYPGRIFDTRSGRFVVVGTARTSGEAADSETLLAEPILVSEVSSPRRRIRVLPVTIEGTSTDTFLKSDDPEPVHLGPYPLALALVQAEVVSEHRATLRVDAVNGDIRHHHVMRPGEGRQRAQALTTEALLLHPNPQRATEGPVLDLEAARRIAAAMRLVLPSLYRGCREALALGLHVLVEEPGVDYVLGPQDSFAFYDLGSGGTGAVRALRRDGMELLLRLTRLVLERVLSHRRLLALHDEWGGSGGKWDVTENGEETTDLARRDQALRHTALTWLDSRLHPEGGPSAVERNIIHPWDMEPGEGDLFDIGRCWYSPGGSVADLVWVKHRWCLAGGREAALDIGFDRVSAEASRFFTEDHEILATYTALYQQQRMDPSLFLKDGRPWSAPHPVWIAPVDGGEPSRSSDPDGDELLDSYHALASAVAAHSRPELEPLARKLLEECDASGPLGVATWISRFVQGIPFSLPESLRQGLRPPVSTLLFRRGDCDSKSLLLAILLEHCGVESGLFVSFPEGHAITAAAVPETFAPPAADAAARSSVAWECLEAWSVAEGFAMPPQFWAELPISPEREGEEHRLFIPIESTVYNPVGAGRVERPETWSFLPLASFRSRVQLEERVMPSDRAEEEVPQ